MRIILIVLVLMFSHMTLGQHIHTPKDDYHDCGLFLAKKSDSDYPLMTNVCRSINFKMVGAKKQFKDLTYKIAFLANPRVFEFKMAGRYNITTCSYGDWAFKQKYDTKLKTVESTSLTYRGESRVINTLKVDDMTSLFKRCRDCLKPAKSINGKTYSYNNAAKNEHGVLVNQALSRDLIDLSGFDFSSLALY